MQIPEQRGLRGKARLDSDLRRGQICRAVRKRFALRVLLFESLKGDNIMIHGFLKACTVSPALRVADCAFNTQQTIAAMQRAALDGAQLAVFPNWG